MQNNDAYLKIELRIFGIRLFSLYCNSNLEQWLNSYFEFKKVGRVSVRTKPGADSANRILCTASLCTHNEDFSCTLNTIAIDDFTKCSMYLPRDEYYGKKSVGEAIGKE